MKNKKKQILVAFSLDTNEKFEKVKKQIEKDKGVSLSNQQVFDILFNFYMSNGAKNENN